MRDGSSADTLTNWTSPTTTLELDLLPKEIVALVLFEKPTHWTGYFTQFYQFLTKKPYWKYVHCVLYLRYSSHYWARTELTWDGYCDDTVTGTVVEDTHSLVVPLFRSQVSNQLSRSIDLQRTFSFLGESGRYSPWVSLLHLFTGSYQWNCVSTVAYTLGTDPCHLPSDLLEVLLK